MERRTCKAADLATRAAAFGFWRIAFGSAHVADQCGAVDLWGANHWRSCAVHLQCAGGCLAVLEVVANAWLKRFTMYF